MKKKIMAYVLGFLALLAYCYVQLPVLKLDFADFYVVAIGFLALVGFLMMDHDNVLMVSKGVKAHFVLAGLLGVIVIVLPFITSTPFFHANAYRSLIGDVVESDFTKDISPVSVEDIRLVDKEMATRLGDKKIGEVPGLGSVAQLGEFHIQSVDEELFWIAPLIHRDAIKWLTNLDGTTGYIMVSATNPQDVRFIQTIDEKPIQIVYQPGAYLHQNLKRHVYFNGHMNVGLTDFTFEIDDAGQPYWVVTLYDHKVGFNGADAIGVATVHASTGEVSSYALNEAPSWIDRIQPELFITQQLTDWGTYVDGFFNAKLAQANVLVPTPGTSLVYGADGKSYWYTGMTSAGADESTIGFILVDTRTKEAKLYKQPGATELAAMQSATGKVQEKGYKATFPVMYNILGTPTYVMSLKDNAGLIKMVAFVSVEDYSLVGVGDTKDLALRSYKDALKTKGNNINIGSGSSTTQELTGKITRISPDVQSGQTYYYFTLDASPAVIFTATSGISSELPLTQAGDQVILTYDSYGDTSLDLITFDNLALPIE